jgi:broad specificity phosphatase PhoE
MSVLTLVRHGQASFFADDYDRLSAVGEQQSRLLGRFWGGRSVVFDEVYTGPRLRQQKSAELTGDAYRAAGLNWPEPVVLEDLDEYDLHGLLHRLAPQLARRDSEFAQLVETYRENASEAERFRNFQRMFESLVRHWQQTDSTDAGVESWPDFHRRVERVIRHLQTGPGRGRRIAVFTSGGFIGGAVQQALAISDESALQLNWRLRNSSLTEFVFTAQRFTLDSFNGVPHLNVPELWTYR